MLSAREQKAPENFWRNLAWSIANYPMTGKISAIGLGTSSLAAEGETADVRAVAFALERGVNYIDMASGTAGAFPAVGAGMEGGWEKAYSPRDVPVSVFIDKPKHVTDIPF